jgi:hypothetical protein
MPKVRKNCNLRVRKVSHLRLNKIQKILLSTNKLTLGPEMRIKVDAAAEIIKKRLYFVYLF